MPEYKETTITPELAKKWLDELNIMNRKIRPAKITEFKRMMEKGQWRPDNGIPMAIFDTDGILVDGQHRAIALAETGITLEGCTIVEGVSPRVRPTIDGGTARNFGDDLTMNQIVNGAASATLLRRILTWEQYQGLAAISHQRYTRPDLAAAFPGHAYEISETIKSSNRWMKRWSFSNRGAMTFMYWLLRFKDNSNPQLVDKFFQTLCIGSVNDEDKVLMQCKDKLIGQGNYRGEQGPRSKKQRAGAGPEYDVYWLILGWNAWIKGIRRDRFQLPPGGLHDPFPKREKAYSITV